MRPVMLLGRNGQLGFELNQQLAGQYPLVVLGSADLDLANEGAIRDTLQQYQPGLLINCAAYTAVDRAETEESQAFAINANAPAILAEEMKKRGGALIHYSTDYVFDGKTNAPYRESDVTNPQNVYGRSKLAGEQAILASGAPALIFRTSWVYGARGHNFLLTMIRLLQEREEIRVVDDQIGAPTSVNALARATLAIVKQSEANGFADWMEKYKGVYHMSCAGQTSWFGFARAIAEHLQSQGKAVAQIEAITTDEFPLPARRPHWSILDNTKLRAAFGVELPDWQKALDEVFSHSVIA